MSFPTEHPSTMRLSSGSRRDCREVEVRVDLAEEEDLQRCDGGAVKSVVSRNQL